VQRLAKSEKEPKVCTLWRNAFSALPICVRFIRTFVNRSRKVARILASDGAAEEHKA
jgi:predicted nuclease with RNAse H fold